MKILVTGASGFIGHHLTNRLRTESHDVIPWSLRSSADLNVSPCSVDVIFHCAADSSSPDVYHQNTILNNTVLRKWQNTQPRARLVVMGSLWAFPNVDGPLGVHEMHTGDMIPYQAAYGQAKRDLAVELARCHALTSIMLVLGTVYGPRDHTTQLIPKLIRNMLTKAPELHIFHSPNEIRQFTYIDDQINGILQTYTSGESVLNISHPTPTKFFELVAILNELTNYKGRVMWHPPSIPKCARWLDTSHTQKLCNWPVSSTMTTLHAGLSKTIQWIDSIL